MPPATIIHHDVLSGITNALGDISKQLHNLVARERIFSINGGTFNSAGGDIYNTYSFNYHVDAPTHRRVDGDKGQQHSIITQLAPNLHKTSFSAQALSPQVRWSISPPSGFEDLEVHLNSLSAQMQFANNRGLNRIQSSLRDLNALVMLSSYAYDALDSPDPINVQATRVIDWRILQCAASLSRARQGLLNIHSRRLPLLGLVHYRIHDQWWEGWETREAGLIQQQLHAEARHFAEWLSALTSFCWIYRRALLPGQSHHLWNALRHFMKDGPQLLREVHVERIFVLEPVEGEHLTIPLRFVNSYEDVHRVIHLACLGSQSARYIESRSYELDEFLSNQAVDPYNFHTVMKDGKTLEMTILIQIPVLTIGICPRCELEHPVQDAVLTSWTRCRGCNAQFSFSEVQHDAGGLSGAERILTSEKALSILGAHRAMLGAEPLPSPMFRRMRIKTELLAKEETRKTIGSTDPAPRMENPRNDHAPRVAGPGNICASTETKPLAEEPIPAPFYKGAQSGLRKGAVFSRSASKLMKILGVKNRESVESGSQSAPLANKSPRPSPHDRPGGYKNTIMAHVYHNLGG